MIAIIFVLTIFSISAQAVDFPECDNIFASVDEMVAAPSIDEAAYKKNLFKIVNDKRIEVMRFVRQEKETYRKAKESELTAFDVESKKNKATTSDEKSTRRKEREVLSKQISADKKEFNKDLDTKEKTCQAVLNAKRMAYLEKMRDLKRAPKQTKRNEVIIPELDEFNDIPKGPGTVLKPQ